MVPLSFLCNRSLNEGVFPLELKSVNVLPLFKSGDVLLFNNYRPVSLLCKFSMVFEEGIYSRLLNFMDYHKILIMNQFRFRRLRSSYMALIQMMDQVTNALDKGKGYGIFLDFSQAFDTTNHAILHSELHHYGVRGNDLDWLRSYLSDRKQYMSYNGVSPRHEIDYMWCSLRVNTWTIIVPALRQWLVLCMLRICVYIICWWYQSLL